MKYIGIKAKFEADNPELAAEIIAAGFFDLDLKGVVIESPEYEVPEGAYTDEDLIMPTDNAVTSYVLEDDTLLEKVENLTVILDNLAKTAGFTYKLEFITLDERDWAEAWKDHFYPVRLSPRIVIKPSWRNYKAEPNDIVLEIDPGMAFGTGTHPTTYLCVRLIEKYLQPNDTFLDIGCGSGILMLAALKLLAKEIFGVDNDPIATQITCDNMRLNNIDANCYTAICGHLATVVPKKYDMAAANILAPVIKDLLPDMPTVLKQGGLAIFSGILNRDREMMERAIVDKGFELVETQVEKDWIAIVGKLK